MKLCVQDKVGSKIDPMLSVKHYNTTLTERHLNRSADLLTGSQRDVYSFCVKSSDSFGFRLCSAVPGISEVFQVCEYHPDPDSHFQARVSLSTFSLTQLRTMGWVQKRAHLRSKLVPLLICLVRFIYGVVQRENTDLGKPNKCHEDGAGHL